MPNQRRVLLPFALTALAAATHANAQNVLEEIIVTAEKRESSLQDTPIAVSAFSQESLDKNLIFNAMDMQFNVPNMSDVQGQLYGRHNFAARYWTNRSGKRGGCTRRYSYEWRLS